MRLQGVWVAANALLLSDPHAAKGHVASDWHFSVSPVCLCRLSSALVSMQRSGQLTSVTAANR